MIYAIIFQEAFAVAEAFIVLVAESSPLTVRKVLSEGLVRRKPRKLFQSVDRNSRILEPP